VKTENGRGRGGGGLSLMRDLIELVKTDVITIPPEQRERVLERARREAEIWRGGSQISEATAQECGAAEPAPRRSVVSRLRLAGHIRPRSATATS
jgi:hypothetical protein